MLEAAVDCSLTWKPMASLALGRIASRNKRKQKHNTTQSNGLLHDMSGRLIYLTSLQPLLHALLL